MPPEILDKGEHGEEETKELVSVSSTFFPGSHSVSSDSIFRSSDSVLFYVNSEVVLGVSQNAFCPLLGASLAENRFRNTVIDIPDTSVILNIIVHTMYGLSCARNSPSLDDIEMGVDRMPSYGLVPSELLVPGNPLYELLLSHAPLSAIQVYTLAGHHGLHDLAENASSHLLSYCLPDITDAMANRMGAKYLRRLMNLHLLRKGALKSIIIRPPHPHPPTAECDVAEQKKLSRAWALAASYLAWDSRPDLPVHAMQDTFSTLGDHITCEQCKEMLKTRTKEVSIEWVNVQHTI